MIILFTAYTQVLLANNILIFNRAMMILFTAYTQVILDDSLLHQNITNEESTSVNYKHSKIYQQH